MRWRTAHNNARRAEQRRINERTAAANPDTSKKDAS